MWCVVDVDDVEREGSIKKEREEGRKGFLLKEKKSGGGFAFRTRDLISIGTRQG